MNPSDPMKLHPEDPRLTACVLGELAASECAAVAQAIAADSALQAEVREIEGIQRFLGKGLHVSGHQLSPVQREGILRHARSVSNSSGLRSLAELRDAVQPWIIPASAAAVLALATFILIQMSGDHHPALAANKPAPSPPLAASQTTTSGKPPIEDGATTPVAVNPQTLELPINSATTSLVAVSKAILTEGKLPPHEAVRLSEILNHFPLRLHGVTSISRSSAAAWHPDNRDSGVTNHAATLSTELIACPWKPSATLLLISIRANAKVDCDVKLTYRPNPATVLRRRLLGFPLLEGQTAATTPDRIPAGGVASLAIEIEPSSVSGNFGTLEWSTDGTPAPAVSLVHSKEVEPSDDARFAALVCTFSLWLLGDSSGVIDVDVVAALAREIASSTLPPERTEFLNLIDKSLNL